MGVRKIMEDVCVFFIPPPKCLEIRAIASFFYVSRSARENTSSPIQKIEKQSIFFRFFENAYNNTDRALLLELTIALVPEAANVLWWLYERETIMMTHRGDEVTCSTGVMQGCSFAAIAFSLVVKWLVSQMKHPGLERKQFFMDDGLLHGTPASVKWSLDLIEKVEPISRLIK